MISIYNNDSAWSIKIKRTFGNQEMVKCKDLARMSGVREARNLPCHHIAFLTNKSVTDILIIFVKRIIHQQIAKLLLAVTTLKW